MANSFMADIGTMGAQAVTAKKSTSRAGNTELKMEDFLKLMVVQLQNQSIDDTADTGEMLNQLVQMQMVTALSNMTDASVMSYASSLVGKEVTIGYLDDENNLKEEVLNVIGTGVYNGQQVVFCDDGKMYQLSQIMAVGRLPDLDETEEPEDTGEENELEAFEKAVKERVDATNASIKDGSFNASISESADKRTATDDVGAVKAPESAQKSNYDTGTETGNRTFDPFEKGLLDGVLVNPNPAEEAYTGEQGADTEAAE